jgi:pyridoxal phosphate enzyme (YggS family)
MPADNIAKIRERIAAAAERSGRDPGDVRLVAVSKTVGTDLIRQAVEAGQRVFGENRVQEALEKIAEIRAPGLEWHMIGRLQRNKAKFVAGTFSLVHSVDSAELAEELQKHAEKKGIVQRILVEVKLSEEETKGGVGADDLEALLGLITGLRNLRLEGLMTVPPFFPDPEAARPYFRRLREMRDRLQDRGFSLPELSMGMSGDFEAAVEEGATLVRVGSAIFGERVY